MGYANRRRWPEVVREHHQLRRRPVPSWTTTRASTCTAASDGENWVPVTTNGMGNPYNMGLAQHWFRHAARAVPGHGQPVRPEDHAAQRQPLRQQPARRLRSATSRRPRPSAHEPRLAGRPAAAPRRHRMASRHRRRIRSALRPPPGAAAGHVTARPAKAMDAGRCWCWCTAARGRWATRRNPDFIDAKVCPLGVARVGGGFGQLPPAAHGAARCEQAEDVAQGAGRGAAAQIEPLGRRRRNRVCAARAIPPAPTLRHWCWPMPSHGPAAVGHGSRCRAPCCWTAPRSTSWPVMQGEPHLPLHDRAFGSTTLPHWALKSHRWHQLQRGAAAVADACARPGGQNHRTPQKRTLRRTRA